MTVGRLGVLNTLATCDGFTRLEPSVSWGKSRM